MPSVHDDELLALDSLGLTERRARRLNPRFTEWGAVYAWMRQHADGDGR